MNKTLRQYITERAEKEGFELLGMMPAIPGDHLENTCARFSEWVVDYHDERNQSEPKSEDE